MIRPLPQQLHTVEPDDEFEQLFPGCTLTHLLTVVSQDQLTVAFEALLAVRAFGGGLNTLHLTSLDGRTELRLRVTGLRPCQARLLSRWLAAAPGVERASVEHQILRLGASTGR